jgi:hypothetical protein
MLGILVKINIRVPTSTKDTTMSSWTLKTPPTFRSDAVASASGWKHPVTGEVLVAIRGLTTKNVDALVVPTFTLAVPADATYTVGQALVFTVTASEAVSISGTPSIDVTIGSTVRQAQFTGIDATQKILTFSYTLVAGDADADGIAVANTIDLNTVGKGKSKVVDQVAGSGGQPIDAAALTFTVPATTGIKTSA